MNNINNDFTYYISFSEIDSMYRHIFTILL